MERDENIRGDQLIIHHFKNFKNIQVTHLIAGESKTTLHKLNARRQDNPLTQLIVDGGDFFRFQINASARTVIMDFKSL